MPTSIFFILSFHFPLGPGSLLRPILFFFLSPSPGTPSSPLYVSFWRRTKTSMAPVHLPLPLALETFALSTSYQHERSFVLHGEPIQRIKIPLCCLNCSGINPSLEATMSSFDLPVPAASVTINRTPRCASKPSSLSLKTPLYITLFREELLAGIYPFSQLRRLLHRA